MAAAIEAGIPKLRIEEAAARTQARIDSGAQAVIGVNTHRVDDEDVFDVRRVDNDDVYRAQIAKLERLRAERDDDAVRTSLDAITAAAERGDGNLLELAVDAARAKATVGEMSDAMEQVWGRHRAEIRTISGVYTSSMAGHGDTVVAAVLAATEAFEAEEGRRPRILVAKMGQDGHDRGANLVSSAFGDLGFEVVAGPLFQTPREAAELAVEKDVDVVGASSLAAGHKTLIPELIDALKEAGRADIKVVAGGVIPPQDYAMLREAGVQAIFGPGTNLADAADEVLRLLGHNKPPVDEAAE
jgi:methylmalonyl-CoA mutase